MVALAKQVGQCSDCENSPDAISAGFRVAFQGVVESTETLPPTVGIVNGGAMEVRVLGVGETFCGTQEASAMGSPMAELTATGIGGGNDSFTRMRIIHGSLMLIAWGWLLPSGALISRFFRHRNNDLWFKIHRMLQPLGLAIAIAGWAIALTNFNVFGDFGYPGRRHGIMGCAVMAAGIFQPINAVIRPHAPDKNEKRTTLRLMWEILHKSLGWVTILLAFATIGLGTTLLGNAKDQRTFQIAFGAGCGGLLLLSIAFMICDERRYPGQEEGALEDDEMEKA